MKDASVQLTVWTDKRDLTLGRFSLIFTTNNCQVNTMQLRAKATV